jgi:hypothetical protein
MERSTDRFLVLQLGKEDLRPRCRYPYMRYRKVFAAAYLDSFWTRSQEQMASKDMDDSFEKWNEGRVRPDCEPCSSSPPVAFKTGVLILDPSTTTTGCPRHNRYQSDIRTERGPDIPYSAPSCF